MGERYVSNIFLYFFFFLGGGDFTHCTLNSRRAIPDTYQLGLYVLDIPNSRLLSGLNDSIFSTKVSPVDHLSPFHSYKHVQKLKRIFPNGIMVRKKNWFTDILTTELIWNKITTTKITINFHFLKPETCITAETRAASCTVLQSVVENILPLTFLSFKVIIK